MSSGEADAPYWAALAQGKLELPRCAGCDNWQWPAVSRCGECGSWESVWHDLPRAGTVFTWTRTHHPFGGIEGIEKPFVTVIVSIDGTDDKRLMGLYADAANDPVIGDKVTAEVAHVAFGDRQVPTLRWTPAQEAAR